MQIHIGHTLKGDFMKVSAILSLATILVSGSLLASEIHYGDKVKFALKDAYYIDENFHDILPFSEYGKDNFYHEDVSKCTGTIGEPFGASRGGKELYEIEHLHCSYPGPNYTVYLFK